MGYGRPYTKLYFHLVWATYERLPLIRLETEPRLYQAIRAKLHELRCVPLAIGGTEDHIHCLCSLPPTVSVSHVIQQVKGSSSHLMTHKVTGRDSFRWQGSYGAFTLRDTDIATVRAYLLNQRHHHAENSVWPEWEQDSTSDDLPDHGA